MEPLKKLLRKIYKVICIIFPFEDFVYILQLDDYSTYRYLKQLFKPPYQKFLKRNLQKRESIKYTTRAILTILMSWILFLLLFFLLNSIINNIYIKIFSWIFVIVSIPLIVGIVNILMQISRLVHLLDKYKAKKYVKILHKLKIIGITGSYGKTTTKNLLFEFLRYNYKTQLIEGNINTPIGIAKWINNNLLDETEILIVEMGTNSKGTIKESVQITPPNYAIITELGDQHLERFKTFENIVDEKLEIFSINNSNKYILENVYKKIKKKKQFKNLNIIDEQSFKNDFLLPTDFNLGNYVLAISVAIDLGISKEFISDSITKFTLPQRRKNISNIKGFVVIDDSYNISLNTAEDSLNYAKEYSIQKNKSLIVITGGIPESAINYATLNKKFGNLLEDNSHHIVLLNSVFRKYIQEGIKNKHIITTKESMENAMNYIFENYDPEKYVILQLPELSDLSY
jgi:UDP-N-acetylmuramoyl-tripeptide--D-alanyl-D-alanine ligase